MPKYEYDIFNDLRVYKVNVKTNAHVMILFSGSWYPSLTPELCPVCDHMKLYYSEAFDVFTISSDKDYLTLYQNDSIYDFLKKCCTQVLDNGEINFISLTCFCMCVSAPFITNIIDKLNKSKVVNKLNVISYESPFELIKQSKHHKYKSFVVNYPRLKNNKRATYPLHYYFYVNEYTNELFEQLTNEFNKRMLIKITSINMKTPYTLYCIYSKNDFMIDNDMNEIYKNKPKRNGFKLHNYVLESYSHVNLLTSYICIAEPTQFKLFFRHLDDIIASIIE